MIKEDYVSLETAKLLKERGFNNFTTIGWSSIDPIKEPRKFIPDNGRGGWYDSKEEWISRPSLSLVMKWLREVHNIIITVRLFNSAEHFYLGEPNQFTVDIATTTMSSQKGHIRAVYSTYEEAAESAIKYVLENLI